VNVLRSAYAFFKSVRLAIVLIVVIVVLSLLATLVPQGRPDAWYQSHYSPGLFLVIRALHAQDFFSSAIFLVPVCFFTVNLAFCTVDRFVRRVRTRSPRRYGPDLIHIGLLVLIASGLVTASGRAEQTQFLAEGQEADIGSGYTLRLLSFEFLRYGNGSPRDWISKVAVAREGLQETASFPIQVNHPLRLRGLTVYQSSWDVNGTLRLKDADGNDVVPPSPGDSFPLGDSRWMFAAFRRDGSAWGVEFRRYRGGDLEETRILRPGDSIGPFTVTGITGQEITGLKTVRDPGLAPFLAAVLLIVAGLCLTFIQQRTPSASRGTPSQGGDIPS
jgi:cytochrome c biogenesis protein ResB